MVRATWFLIVCLTTFVLPDSTYGQRSNQVARGARLWNVTCNQCHNQRSPLERTDAQWDVIASHMRTRANLTKAQVQALVAFLQEANGDQEGEGSPSGVRPRADSTVTAPKTTGRDSPDARQNRPGGALTVPSRIRRYLKRAWLRENGSGSGSWE